MSIKKNKHILKLSVDFFLAGEDDEEEVGEEEAAKHACCLN